MGSYQQYPQQYDPYRQGQYGSQPPQGGGYYPQQQGYAPYPPQPMVMNSAKPKKSGMGGAGMLAAGAGAGLLGGLLVADAVDDFGDNDYDDGGTLIPLCFSRFGPNVLTWIGGDW